MAEYVNPFLRGVMGTRAVNERSAAQEIGILSRLAQLQMQQQAAQQAAEMRPLQIDALRSQIEERNAKVRAGQQQQQALSMLSRLQSPEGSYTGPVAPGVPTAVAGNEQDALRMVMEAEAQGRPMGVNVPNQGNVRTLASLAFPKEYGEALSKSFFPDPTKTQPLVKIRDPNNANRYIWSTREGAVGAEAQGDEVQRFLAGLAAGRMAYDTGAAIPNAPAGVSVPTVAPTPAPVAPTQPGATQPGPQMPNFTGSPREVAQARNKWLMDQSKPGAGGKASDAVVDAIVSGRMAVPTGFALRSPYWQDVIERVANKDPNFDATKYGARAAARRTFASGPEARNVTAINTVIGHLGTLDEAAGALENGDIRMLNTIQNRIATELGDPRVQNFDTAKQAVAEETMRVFRQVGASESEARMWGERITASGSPTQLRGVIKTLGDLLDSRVEAIGRQYDRTVNEGGNPASVDPKNRRVLDRLRGKPQTNAKGWRLMTDANGNAAYVGPNNEIEEVR